MSVLIVVLEIIGTVAFAVSGAMTAFKKDMDLLGVLILGFTTALGGGVIRDIMLGINPPSAFTNPLYAFVALGTAFIMFLPRSGRIFKKIHFPTEAILLIMDTLGLGVFTVLGAQTAYQILGLKGNAFALIFFGVLTGVGGGVLRDTMAGNTPYIFVKHFYATASIFGVCTYVVLLNLTEEFVAILSGTAVIIVLRLCAAHFRWRLPKHKQ